jgi:hypothetical protein
MFTLSKIDVKMSTATPLESANAKLSEAAENANEASVDQLKVALFNATMTIDKLRSNNIELRHKLTLAEHYITDAKRRQMAALRAGFQDTKTHIAFHRKWRSYVNKLLAVSFPTDTTKPWMCIVCMKEHKDDMEYYQCSECTQRMCTSALYRITMRRIAGEGEDRNRPPSLACCACRAQVQLYTLDELLDRAEDDIEQRRQRQRVE